MTNTAAIILAAGKGTRMVSQRPKVLHQLGGKYLVQHVIDGARQAGIRQIILVIGHGGEEVQQALGPDYTYAWQKEQLGTGHAVMMGMDCLAPQIERVLVLSGDTPLLQGETISRLINEYEAGQAKAAILTSIYEEPTGYGRIIRDQEGRVARIVEQRDGTPEELQVQEINSGVYCFCRNELAEALTNLQPDNIQGEYYLTDVIHSISNKGLPIVATVGDAQETMGINDRIQLAQGEAVFRERVNGLLMSKGVTIIDPATTYIEGKVEIGQDTIIHPFTILKGRSIIGEGGSIGPNVTMTDSVIGNEVEIRQAVLEEAKVGNNAVIGPFSYLRPGTVLADNVRIGDFVEVKNAQIGSGSKVPHLTYIGDAVLGSSVNIGAGTITCNYDGQNKHQTIIQDGAFIGSNSNLVAPIQVGKKAYVAAGSTLTADVPEDSLAVARGRQRVIPDWEQRKKKKE